MLINRWFQAAGWITKVRRTGEAVIGICWEERIGTARSACPRHVVRRRGAVIRGPLQRVWKAVFLQDPDGKTLQTDLTGTPGYASGPGDTKALLDGNSIAGSLEAGWRQGHSGEDHSWRRAAGGRGTTAFSLASDRISSRGVVKRPGAHQTGRAGIPPRRGRRDVCLSSRNGETKSSIAKARRRAGGKSVKTGGLCRIETRFRVLEWPPNAAPAPPRPAAIFASGGRPHHLQAVFAARSPLIWTLRAWSRTAAPGYPPAPSAGARWACQPE